MKQNDENLYVANLEEENERMRRELRELREDVKDLTYEKYKAEREVKKMARVDLSEYGERIVITDSACISPATGFQEEEHTVNISIKLVGPSYDDIVKKAVLTFKAIADTRGLFGIDPDKVDIK